MPYAEKKTPNVSASYVLFFFLDLLQAPKYFCYTAQPKVKGNMREQQRDKMYTHH